VHHETLSVVAVRVSNEDRSPVGVHSCDAAPTPTGFVQIGSDDFPIFHVWRMVALLLYARHDRNRDYTFADVFLRRRFTPGFPYARRRVSLNDCASAIIYSRRRKIFLEAHWFPAASHWISYRVVADLGRTAMDY
jgi:hypothetical protein